MKKDYLEMIESMSEEEFNDFVFFALKEMTKRVDEAINYINSNPLVFKDENYVDVETLLNCEDEESNFISHLLKILKGG